MIPDSVVKAALPAYLRSRDELCLSAHDIIRSVLEAAAPMMSHTKELHFGDGKVLVRQGDTPQGEKVLALAQGDVAFPINDHPTEWKTEEPKEAFDVFITFSNIESARVLQDTLNEIVCRWSRELSRPAQPLDGAAMTAPKTILPCPFCGVTPHGVGKYTDPSDGVVKEWQIGCYRNGGPSPCPVRPSTGWKKSEEEALSAWNTRFDCDGAVWRKAIKP